MITVRRFRRAADGLWDEISPVTFARPPASAYVIAAERSTGPIAPTADEIAAACRAEYGRVAMPGYGTAGDIDVEVSIC